MVALVFGGIFGGCGGGGGGTTAPTGSLTKAQWLKKASAICEKGTHEMGRLDVEAWKKYDPSHKHVTEAISDEVAFAQLPVREEELKQIRTLGLPRGDEAHVEKMLEAWADGIAKGKEDHHSLRAPGSEFAFYKSYSMGIDYGLEACWLG